jgi:hypothetical protein
VGKRGGLTHLPLSLGGRGVGWQVGVGWLAIWIRFEHVCLLVRRGGNIKNKILWKQLFYWTIGGAPIIPRSLKTKQNKKPFQDRPKVLFIFKSYMIL